MDLYCSLFSSVDRIVTLYHKIQPFEDCKKRDCKEEILEKEKMQLTSIFSFFHNVFSPSVKKFCCFSQFFFSANGFILDTSII